MNLLLNFVNNKFILILITSFFTLFEETNFAIIFRQMSSKKKKDSKTIFETIRKPTAPPSKKIGQDKPESKIHPTNRKAKHKKKDDTEN